MSKKPVVLMILDGYGLNEKTEGNAVAMAKTPVMDRLMKECPFVRGNASGMAVGLPDGQMGSKKRILNKKNRCSTPILKQLQKIKTMKVIRLNKMLNKIDVTNEFYIVFSNNLYILH